jgi:hypothetical protein
LGVGEMADIKRLGALFILSLVAFAACSSSEIETAFSQKMKPDESQKVIVKYCVSCHQHKEFTPSAHSETLAKKLAAGQGGTECRTCHTYSKNWLFDVKRGTHVMKENG